jgi:Flp pilus assembly protein TadB
MSSRRSSSAARSRSYARSVPTRKQRRRRQKDRRHEYEIVYVDDEGRELAPEDVEEVASRNGKKQEQKTAPRGRGGRPVQPPSWRRVIKRGLLFAPFMFLLITFLSPDLTTVQTLVQTVFLLLIFLPFSYVMDSVTYRMITKRQAKLESEGAQKR